MSPRLSSSCSGPATGDEPPHQIHSYTLLFSLFLHFPYIANPPLCTSAPTRPHAIALALARQSRLFDGHMTYNSHVFTSILSISNVPPSAVQPITRSRTAWSGTFYSFAICSHSCLPFVFNLPVFTFHQKNIITEAPTNCLYESPPELRFRTYASHLFRTISHYFALFRIASHCHDPTVSTSHNTPGDNPLPPDCTLRAP